MSWERFGAQQRRWPRDQPDTVGRRVVGLLLAVAAVTVLLPASRSDPLPPLWWLPLAAAALGIAVMAVKHRRAGPDDGADVDQSRRTVPSFLAWLDHLLTFVWWVGLLAIVGAVVAGLLGPRTFMEGPEDGLTIAVQFEVPEAIGADAPSEDLFRMDVVDGSVTIIDPDFRARASTILLGGLAMAAGLLVVHQLRGVVRSAVNGDPFAPPNARRLRTVGAVTILVGLAWEPLTGFLVAQTVDRTNHNGPPVLGPPDASLIILVVPGLVLLALAEVFRWGQGLRDDQALTV